MAEKTYYTVISFYGTGGYVNGEYRDKKEKLSDVLERSSRFSCHTTKDFHNRSDTVFDAGLMSMEDIKKGVAEGLAIFPINVSTDIADVKNYLDLGLTVKFMRDKEFKRFKKDYTVES